jgi:uncharacterized protein
MVLKSEQDIIDLVTNNDFMMKALKVAKSANLPNWYIGAGFMRNTVWDAQHGYDLERNYNDIDIGYFDSKNVSEEQDEKLSKNLKNELNVSWEVVNQAYAHKYNNVPPYKSAIDGLAHWVETATSVAATLDDNNQVKIIAPWGVEDLLNLKLRLVPYHIGNKYYEDLFKKRIKDKRWIERWPRLKIE